MQPFFIDHTLYVSISVDAAHRVGLLLIR